MPLLTHRPRFAAVALGALVVAGLAPGANAAEAYVSAGFPYALVGVSQPLGPSLGLRADFGGIARRNYSGSTSDDDFKGNISYTREALVGDWFVAGGNFRLTGGATINQAKATMRASPRNGQLSIGGVSYAAPASTYYVESDLSLPKVMPYLGIGWGHHDNPERGFTFNADVGASIGTARATALKPSAALASELALSQTGQSDLASENQQYQDDVKKLKAIPQLTFGFGYRF